MSTKKPLSQTSKRYKLAKKAVISSTPSTTSIVHPGVSTDKPVRKSSKKSAAGRSDIVVETHTKTTTKLPPSWQILTTALRILKRNYKLFAGIGLIYLVLNLLLVRGLSGLSGAGDVVSLKDTLSELFSGQFAALGTGFAVFALLVASAGNNSSQVAGVYQTLLTLIVSLAVIWALRQVLSGATNVRIRDGFYKGMYPIIPSILVLLVVLLQLIPLIIGSSLYSLVVSNGIAATLLEQILWGLVFLSLAFVSLYMVVSSIFALYVVTLPDMTPMKALRSAGKLVRGRRWTILRKVLFLPLVLLIAASCVMVPVILLVTPFAPWLLFILTMFGLIVIHAYMYTLYRKLLV